MFKRKTVFVIGAGGSADFGLPLGDELKGQIADAVNIDLPEYIRGRRSGSLEIYQALNQTTALPDGRPGNIGPYVSAGQTIARGMTLSPSIDNFLQVHSDNSHIACLGKLGIANSILKAEHSSSLQYDRTNIYNKPNFAQIGPTWLSEFVKLLLIDVKKEDSSSFENVEVVTFNYDRIIEEYLSFAISNQWDIPIEDARKYSSQVQVTHVYGTVGLLPWQNGEGYRIEFGAELSGAVLNQSASMLRTFSETNESNETEDRILQLVRESERIVFIGFSFMSINMKFFAIPERDKHRAIIATGLGLSKSDRELIETELANLHARPTLKPDWSKEFGLKFEEVKGAELLRNYARFLSS